MEKNTSKSNENLTALANNVLALYGIKAQKIDVIQSGTVKTVWRVTSNDRKLCLKRLKQTIDKALFSVSAQIYIRNAGGKVPSIFPCLNGQNIAQFNNELFVLYEWIDGISPDFGTPQGLRAAVAGLAAFHKSSRGYSATEAARISSKIGRWPQQYQSMRNKLHGWMTGGTEIQNDAYIRCAPEMVALADLASKLLTDSAYEKLMQDEARHVLCHQDYGTGNAVIGKDGIYVIDLDGVTFDLPARDLRKIIMKQAQNRGGWDEAAIASIITWYTEVNPLSRDEIKMIYIDILFPHLFYGLVKNQFQNGKMLKSSEIEGVTRLERSKISLFTRLLEK